MMVGDPRKYALRKPAHRLLDTHPIVNQHITYYMGHGRIIPQPDVAELGGDQVCFVDDSQEHIAVIIYATDFKISFPFIDRHYLNCKATHPDLHLHVLHPEFDKLFVIGLIQPDSGQFWITDLQARFTVRYIRVACDVMALRAQINFAISSAMNGLTPVVACGTWIQHGIIERSRIVCVTNY